MSEPSTFLSRVYDCKYRFEKQSGFVPTQLFLGPAQMMELNDYIKHLDRDGMLIRDPEYDVNYGSTLAGMTIIDLASDGMRAGISSE